MSEVSTKTYNEQLRDIRDLYQASGQPWPATAREIAMWAINNGHYRAHYGKLIAKAAEEFANAMREEYYTDPQGRKVRALHVARVVTKSADGDREQKMMWDDMRTAPRDFMERAFQLRRRSIVGDCCQLKNDVDSYNDNHPKEKPIQMVLDFTDDAAERSMPVEDLPSLATKKRKPR